MLAVNCSVVLDLYPIGYESSNLHETPNLKKIILPKSRNYLQKQETIGNKFYPTSKKMKNLIEIKREKNSRNLTKRPPQRKLLLKNHRAEFDTV